MDVKIIKVLKVIEDEFRDSANSIYHNTGYDGNGALESAISSAKEDILNKCADVIEEAIFQLKKGDSK